MNAGGSYISIKSGVIENVTLRVGVNKLGLTGNEKYDADMQERMFLDFIFDKTGRRALGAFVKKRGRSRAERSLCDV
jgi:hypothetical protein